MITEKIYVTELHSCAKNVISTYRHYCSLEFISKVTDLCRKKNLLHNIIFDVDSASYLEMVTDKVGTFDPGGTY